MKNSQPKISVVIATRNSGRLLENSLIAIKEQDYPQVKIEIIIADNQSTDNTNKIAKKYDARLLNVIGNPPQVCAQRNIGANNAKGDFVYILDHDMVMSKNLLKNFAERQNFNKNKIDAWYVPEKIVGNNKFWNKIRTYERSFYDGTVVDAVRIIKRDIFKKVQYDTELSSGPGDVDFDIQLKKINCKLDIIKGDYVEHQEQYVSLWKYLSKKVQYFDGGMIYQNKWKTIDKSFYETVVRKQYGPFYRLFGVFIEKGKYKKVLKEFYLFIPMIVLRILVGMFYIFKKINNNYAKK